MTKIAIFALTRGYPNIDDYGALIQRNISIISHLGNKNVDHIDLLLFHEGNILSHHQSEIQRRSNISISFISLAGFYNHWNEASPYANYVGARDDFLVKATPRDMDTGIPWSTGYRNMCHFYAMSCVEILAKMGYSHALRIDEDCLITASLEQFFKEIHNHSDCLIGTPAMYEESHALTNKILPNFLELTNLNYFHSWHESYSTNSPMVYSNVNLYYISNILASPDCNQFYKTLRDTGLIHRCRVGDAPLLFWLSQLKNNSLVIFNSISYRHLSHALDVGCGRVL